ncbi:toxin co-regulated pilus biosynthesis Q family protein [Pseudescherichia vulneris]
MKIMHTSVLLPVLLGGCSLSHTKQTDVDARQFVDGQITTQLQRIAEAQKNLQQTSRTVTPKTQPVARLASGATSNPPISVTGSLRGLSAIKSLGTPEPYSVVRLNARNLKLDTMLQAIIPPGWTPDISSDLKRKFTSTLSMTANDQWPYVLEKLLEQNGWVALIDWPNKQVSVAYRTAASSASPPATSSPLPRPELSKSTVSSPGMKKTASPATTPRNPFSDARGTASPVAPASLTGKPLITAPSVPKITPIPKPLPAPKVWRISAGNTLKDALFNWAAAEKCTTPGVSNWTVAWLTSVNYRVDAPLQFEGSFREALNKLFTLYGTAQVPLYAGVRNAQCVVSVDDKEIH